MAVADRIQMYIRRLPTKLQSEVLNFVERLLAIAAREDSIQDEEEWSDISLSLAMRELEENESPTYLLSDIKESF